MIDKVQVLPPYGIIFICHKKIVIGYAYNLNDAVEDWYSILRFSLILL